MYKDLLLGFDTLLNKSAPWLGLGDLGFMWGACSWVPPGTAVKEGLPKPNVFALGVRSQAPDIHGSAWVISLYHRIHGTKIDNVGKNNS
jgi:hypothetical protein